MKYRLVAAALGAALVLGACAHQRAAPLEAVATVTNVDPSSGTVWVRTPSGETPVMVPAGVDLRDIRPGTRYRVRYSEPVAVALAPGAQPSASSGATAVLEPAPRGAEGLKVERVSGVVEAIDPASNHITVRTLDGRRMNLALADEAVVAGPIAPGDAVTVSYHQALATRMVSTPQPEKDPAPAP